MSRVKKAVAVMVVVSAGIAAWADAPREGVLSFAQLNYSVCAEPDEADRFAIDLPDTVARSGHS